MRNVRCSATRIRAYLFTLHTRDEATVEQRGSVIQGEMDQHIGNCFTSTSPLQDTGVGVRKTFSFRVEDLIADNNESCQQRNCSVKKEECPATTLQSQPNGDQTDPCIDSTSRGKDSKEHEGDCRDISRRKKSRSSFSAEQLCELEKYFSTQRYLGTKERADFAKKIKLSDTQVKTWFQNRRMKLKRQKIEDANRLAKFASAARVGTFPTIRGYDGGQNLPSLPFPLVLPRETIDADLCYRDATHHQSRSFFPVMFSPYSIPAGPTGLFHATTADVFHHR